MMMEDELRRTMPRSKPYQSPLDESAEDWHQKRIQACENELQLAHSELLVKRAEIAKRDEALSKIDASLPR
jgi:hypothetical protein